MYIVYWKWDIWEYVIYKGEIRSWMSHVEDDDGE